MEFDLIGIMKTPVERDVTLIRRNRWQLTKVVIFRSGANSDRSIVYKRGNLDFFSVLKDTRNKRIRVVSVKNETFSTATFEQRGDVRTTAALTFCQGRNRWEPKIWF